MTLYFIGNVENISSFCHEVNGIHVEPFTIRSLSYGTFLHRGKELIGVRFDESAELKNLVDSFGRILQMKELIRGENSFTAHVTIARECVLKKRSLSERNSV